mmetsp:Transcript_9270/g.32060  ORF Transcript_9270/g.32060 Transcript_9270/m.32060 type:complete len:210 (-) Transcript_9270:117-746(-)
MISGTILRLYNIIKVVALLLGRLRYAHALGEGRDPPDGNVSEVAPVSGDLLGNTLHDPPSVLLEDGLGLSGLLDLSLGQQDGAVLLGEPDVGLVGDAGVLVRVLPGQVARLGAHHDAVSTRVLAHKAVAAPDALPNELGRSHGNRSYLWVVLITERKHERYKVSLQHVRQTPAREAPKSLDEEEGVDQGGRRWVAAAIQDAGGRPGWSR